MAQRWITGGATALALLLAALSSGAAQGPDDPAADPPRSPAFSDADPGWHAAQKQIAERHAKLGRADSDAKRESSRSRYRGLSAKAALDVARETFPEQLRGRLFNGSHPARGMEVTKHLGPGNAVVKESATGKRFVVRSTLPLQAKMAKGSFAPVDLSLEDTKSGLTPHNSSAPFIISKDSAQVRFPDRDFAVSVGGKGAGAPKVADDRVFFLDIGPDSDATLVPGPTGVEILLQLRSPQSPERFALSLDLPAGATIRQAQSDHPIENDPPQALEIVADDKVLGYVYPPMAFDADNEPWPDSRSRRNTGLSVAQRSRGSDFR